MSSFAFGGTAWAVLLDVDRLRMGKMQKSSRLRSAWDDIRTSFWFVPSIMMVAAVGLAAFGLWLDFHFAGRDAQSVPWWVYVSKADEVRNVLSTLLSSMITMTSLVSS